MDSQYKQQLLRVDYEKKNKLTKSDIQDIMKELFLQKPEYIIISDYNK
jgi:bifunctional ADP-heptose synthase (sugar kinase/adenylyltransferase)